MSLTPGIDISVWQKVTPSLEGLGFVFCRAGYADSTVDGRYAYHAANVRSAGLVLGAYWFWYDGQDNAQAVKTLLRVAGDADLLVLDLEGRNATTASGRAQARDFINRVHAAGRTIGLYHSLSGFPDCGQDWNWVAYWSAQRPPIPWTFWQYRGSPLDLDYFDGSRSDLLRFVGLEQPDTSTGDDWTVDRIKGEDWKAANGNGVLRKKPVRSDAPFTRLADGTVVRSIGELVTADGNNWRLTEYGGEPAWMLRVDWVPLVQGGAPAVDAALHDYIVRKDDPTPYDDDDLDAAKAVATAVERKRWTDWKATAPA